MGHLLFVVGMISIDEIRSIYLKSYCCLEPNVHLTYSYCFISLDILFAYYYRYIRNSSHTKPCI